MLRVWTWALVVGSAGITSAQQMTIGTPFNSVGHSFSENIGVGFGFTLRGTPGAFPPADRARGVIGINPAGQLVPNPMFQFNNAAGVPLGANAGNGAGGGFAILGGGGSAFFNFNASQGSSSFIESQTPMVTVMNGQQGTFSATTQRPFVFGLVPVVGAGGLPMGNQWQSEAASPAYSTALQEKLARLKQGDTGQPRTGAAAGGGGSANVPVQPTSNAPGDLIQARIQSAQASTAGQATASVRDIESQRAAAEAARDQELADILSQAKAAEGAEKWKVARIYYEQAARRAKGSLQLELQAKVREMGGK